MKTKTEGERGMEGYCLSMQNTLHCLFVFPLFVTHTHTLTYTSGASSLTISIPPRYASLALSLISPSFSDSSSFSEDFNSTSGLCYSKEM